MSLLQVSLSEYRLQLPAFRLSNLNRFCSEKYAKLSPLPGIPNLKDSNYVSFAAALLFLSDVNPRRCVRGHVIQARAGLR